jgi:hypothetical protein
MKKSPMKWYRSQLAFKNVPASLILKKAMELKQEKLAKNSKETP